MPSDNLSLEKKELDVTPKYSVEEMEKALVSMGALFRLNNIQIEPTALSAVRFHCFVEFLKQKCRAIVTKYAKLVSKVIDSSL